MNLTARLKEVLRDGSAASDTEEFYFRDKLSAAFLKSGSLNLSGGYQLLISKLSDNEIDDFKKDFADRLAVKAGSYKGSIFVKDAESISRILAFLGADECVLLFEDFLAFKNIANNVNRQTNCDVFNLSKTAEAAAKQIRVLKNLDISTLSKPLQDVAKLRLKMPDASYSEIAEILKVSKSCVQHRLEKITKK
jgi:hypothetical protein